MPCQWLAGRQPSAPGHRCPSRGGSSTVRDGLDVTRGQGLPTDAPTPALDLFDDHPGDLAHLLALDGNHRVGELANHLLLLGVREDAFDELDLNKWHGQLSALSRDFPDEFRPNRSVTPSGRFPRQFDPKFPTQSTQG